ncbi:CHASE2 domain-containing protein [Luteimonas aquatica]|uniref:CHASE2 domain-containing protein n=1 Tax=Luteimonas aquatica TaxID=450364 RepID=UPI001F564DD2|nr:CHASE2 domain-containing protein [Luteimonas aquatica]
MSGSSRRKSLPLALLIMLGAVACVSLLTLTKLTWKADYRIYDTLLRHAGERADDSVVIVAIDDKSVSALGRWPWPRRTHADLIDRLSRVGARGVALDVVFAEPDSADPDGDIALARAIQHHGRVVLPVLAEPSEPNGPPVEVLPLPALVSASAGLGHVAVDVSRDGITRDAHLYAGLGDAHWPILALALRDLDTDTARTTSVPGLRESHVPRESPYLWERDYCVLIPYVSSGPGFQQVSYVDVLNGRVPDSLLRDRWILVGATAFGTGDTILTPMQLGDGRIPGVEYQANLLNMLLHGHTITPLEHGLQLAAGIFAVALPTWLLFRVRTRRVGWAVPIMMLAVLIASTVLLYRAHLWFAPMPALATLLASAGLWLFLDMRQSQRQAHYDSLTQLANRRLFDTILSRELGSARRSDSPLSLLLIDVDHFKHYNDRYGHQAGDDMLRRVAQAVSTHTRRPRDLPARYGGDELAVILPETNGLTAYAIADAIVDEVRALAIPHADSGVAPVVTVSIGVASCEPGSDTRPDLLIRRTDVALYRAKELGRNCSYRATVWSSEDADTRFDIKLVG